MVVILVLCACFYLICSIIALKVYLKTFGRVEEFRDDRFYPYITWKEVGKSGYSREELYFDSGGNRLQGFIYGKANSKGLIVISQGMGRSVDTYLPMIMYFVDKGWRVFAFNNTGVGGSEGKGARGLYQSLVDLDAALTYIESSSGGEPRLSGSAEGSGDLPIMLAGHSWGGFAVCAVLNYNHRVNAVVSFAGYNSGREVIREKGKQLTGPVYHTAAPVLWAIQKKNFGNVMKITAVDGINKSGVPVMIVQSSNDDTIPANTTSIYAQRQEITNPNVEIVFREGEDSPGHSYVFCSKRQKEYMEKTMANWEVYKAGNNKASQARWAAEIKFDKALANELDAELMERIDEFLYARVERSL